MANDKESRLEEPKSKSKRLKALENGVNNILQMFECSICTSTYVKPTQTPCGHILCGPCAQEICKRGTRHNTAKCPLCKAAISRRSLVVREDINDLWIQANRIKEAYKMDVDELNKSTHDEKIEDQTISTVEVRSTSSAVGSDDKEMCDADALQQVNSTYVDPFEENYDSDLHNEKKDVGESRPRSDNEKKNNPASLHIEANPNAADKTKTENQRHAHDPHYIIVTSSIVPAAEPVAGSSSNMDVQVTSCPLDLSVENRPHDYVPGYFQTAIRFIKPLDLSTKAKGEKRKLDDCLGAQSRNEDPEVNQLSQLKKPRVNNDDDVFKAPRANPDLRKVKNQEISKELENKSDYSPVKVVDSLATPTVTGIRKSTVTTNKKLGIKTTLTPSSKLNIEKIERKNAPHNYITNPSPVKQNSSSRKNDLNVVQSVTNQQESKEHNSQYKGEPRGSRKNTKEVEALNSSNGEKGKEATISKLENLLTNKNKKNSKRTVGPISVEQVDNFGFGSTKTHSDEILENISTEQMLNQDHTSSLNEYVFCSSRLNRVQANKLRQLSELCKGLIQSEFNSNVTHLIINLDNGRVPHTLKYLLAIANRAWVVSYDWVDKCISAGCVLPEERFETSNFEQCDPGPRQSRQSKSNLFEGFKFYFSTEIYKNMGFKFQDVTTLLEILGAEVIQSLDNVEGELVIIGDLTANVSDCVYWMTEKNWISVTFTWLIDCILEYKLIPFGPSHLCMDISDKDLETACVPELMRSCISLYLMQRLHGL